MKSGLPHPAEKLEMIIEIRNSSIGFGYFMFPDETVTEKYVFTVGCKWLKNLLNL